MMDTRTNGKAPALADEDGELFPMYYPKIELETVVTYEGFTFRATFRDTSLAEAVAALTKRGCQPATAQPATVAARAAGETPACRCEACDRYGKPMKESTKKAGSYYCPGKIGMDKGSPVYCKERA